MAESDAERDKAEGDREVSPGFVVGTGSAWAARVVGSGIAGVGWRVPEER